MNPTTNKPLLLTLLAGALTVGAALTPAHAQLAPPLEEQRWYQVEVVLFSQADHLGNEKNLKSVRLGYPKPLVFLDADTAVSPETLARLPEQDLRLYLAMVPDSQLRRRHPAEPVPFAPLPREEQLLAEEVRNLERSGTYQVLFHQAWRQTLAGPRTSPWIVVQGGAPVGNHHELEGALRVYLDTQIVAETNLWRTRFGSSSSSHLSPASPGATGQRPDATAGNPGDSQQAGETGWPALPPPPRPREPQLPALFQTSLESEPHAVDAGDTAALEPQYTPVVLDIDRLETSQIINTRELHYLDHPRLGALFRVIPYNPVQQEEELFEDTLPVEEPDVEFEPHVQEIDDELRD